jgi:hypothetical protein
MGECIMFDFFGCYVTGKLLTIDGDLNSLRAVAQERDRSKRQFSMQSPMEEMKVQQS